MLNGKTVLVTGGAGFIGSELIRQLTVENAKVIAVDNLVNGKEQNLAGVCSGLFELHVCDIRDLEKMVALINGVDIVYHLACLGVRHSFHAPLENHEVNADATLRLLIAAREASIGRFVYVSTSEVYGTTRYLPMNEDHPTLTKTIYGGSKLAGESYARAFFESYRFPAVIVRPFNSFGPCCHHEGDSGEVIPKFMLRCLADEPLVIFGDGTQTRDFTFVEDTARGILMAGLIDNAIGKTINLGRGEEISINQLSEKISIITNKSGIKVVYDKPRPGDVLRLRCDTDKAKKILGYKPTVSIDDGLTKLLEWYKTSKVDARVLLEQEQIYNWVGN